MIKYGEEKGITLISVLIIIVLMAIIATTVVNISLDRFEINDLRKLHTDVELLEDKVSTYYLKYGGLPVLRSSSNEAYEIDETKLDFVKNERDNSIYYIIDLEALSGISLNYGQEGFNNWKSYIKNNSGTIPDNIQDMYIINQNTHTIYYTTGVKLKEETYYYVKAGGALTDNIPPSKPQINIISGEMDEDKKYYKTEVEVAILPGQDNWSGVGGIEYTIKKVDYTTQSPSEQKYTHAEDSEKFEKITENGLYTIEVKTFDNANNYSDAVTIEFYVHIEHTWDSGETKTEATCTTNGTMKYTCTFEWCGQTKTEIIPALGHNMSEWETVTSETCTTNGSKKRECQREGCDYSETDTIPALGHLMGEWYTVVEPTCTEDGNQQCVCQREGCDYSDTAPIAKLGHDMSEWETVTPPTCTTDGSQRRDCQRGGCDYSETNSIPALGHDMSEWETVTPPTCTTDGSQRRDCQRGGCDYSETNSIPALGHDMSTWRTISPTCTTDGSKRRECQRDGCNYFEEEIIPALGHRWADGQVTKVATCVETGTTTYECNRYGCDAKKYEEIPINPDNHESKNKIFKFYRLQTNDKYEYQLNFHFVKFECSSDYKNGCGEVLDQGFEFCYNGNTSYTDRCICENTYQIGAIPYSRSSSLNAYLNGWSKKNWGVVFGLSNKGAPNFLPKPWFDPDWDVTGVTRAYTGIEEYHDLNDYKWELEKVTSSYSNR